MAKHKTIIGPPKLRCPNCQSTRTVATAKRSHKPVIRRHWCRKCGEIFNVQEPDKKLAKMLDVAQRVIISERDKLAKKIYKR